jgi:alanine-synthesizing transaminase
VKPQGALYLFPRLDPEAYPIRSDRQFVLDLLQQKHLLLVEGTAFNWPDPDHLRLVFLPYVDVLEEAIGRLHQFLAQYQP